MIMATAAAAAVVGLSTRKRFLLLQGASDPTTTTNTSSSSSSSSSIITATAAKKSSSNLVSNSNSRRPHSSIKAALKDPQPSSPCTTLIAHGASDSDPDPDSDPQYLVDALLLLQKSMLEKQWNLAGPQKKIKIKKKIDDDDDEVITCSGTSARRRRIDSRRRRRRRRFDDGDNHNIINNISNPDDIEYLVRKGKGKGVYVKGGVSEQQQLLTHAQVVQLSHKIKAGLALEDRRSTLKQRLGGIEPSDEQLARSLRMSRANLQSKMIECSLAREKLAMSNVRLVMSIAQRYDNMGAQMPDLIQGGLIGLLRGIEKFDSSKGFKISTYVYWWIRQGVSRALVESSRTLRLPTHLHERLSLIRNAKARLHERGITPSIHRIAENLNMTERKVRNATEAVSKVYSLDREAYPSLNGLPGETLHSYIADTNIENNPWTGVEEWALKDEVDKLINATLREREREIIRLYYGLDNECLTWEDISRRMGLSRERVRQVGLVALEKLKHAARKSGLEAMLLQH